MVLATGKEAGSELPALAIPILVTRNYDLLADEMHFSCAEFIGDSYSTSPAPLPSEVEEHWAVIER